MYSTKTAIERNDIPELMRQLSDYDVYAYYIGKFQVGKLYNSPLRSDDKNPSFAIFPSRRGDLLYKDHGSGDSGNSLTFVKAMLGTDDNNKIAKELMKILRSTKTTKSAKRVINYTHNSSANIGIVRQKFTDVDTAYWGQFNIDIPTLQYYNVFSIKYYLVGNIVKEEYKKDCPMYAYKVNNAFKIYRPLAKSRKDKWRNNLTNSDIQGLKQLKYKSDTLIITKSMKDVMTLYKMGYEAVSPSSETTFIPDDIYNKLKKKYSHIVILFDRDVTGMQQARKYSKLHSIPAFFIHKKYKTKDVSDCVKKIGFEETKKFIDTEIGHLKAL